MDPSKRARAPEAAAAGRARRVAAPFPRRANRRRREEGREEGCRGGASPARFPEPSRCLRGRMAGLRPHRSLPDADAASARGADAGHRAEAGDGRRVTPSHVSDVQAGAPSRRRAARRGAAAAARGCTRRAG